jgi:CheY-like chemotaxis protein
VDALLAGNSGYDLCQQIKAEAPQVGVIVLSSKQHPYDRVKGGAVGADDFLDKPYDTQALIDKVAALTQKLASAPAVKPAAAGLARPAAATAQAAQAAQAPQAAASQASTAAAAQAQSTKPHTTTMSFSNPAQIRPAPAAPAAVTAPAAAPRPAPVAAPAATPIHQAPRPVGAPVAAPAQPAVRPGPTAPTAAASSALPVQPSVAQAPVVAAAQPALAGVDASMETKLSALGLTKDQIAGVLALSREVIEQVVWEVVPVLAETMIREEIDRLSAE